jgi:hypothetical protein
VDGERCDGGHDGHVTGCGSAVWQCKG